MKKFLFMVRPLIEGVHNQRIEISLHAFMFQAMKLCNSRILVIFCIFDVENFAF